MEYNYSKRGYHLPDGCEDLIDVIRPKTNVAEGDFFVVTIQLPGLENAYIEILVKGNTLRIIVEGTGSDTPHENKIEVLNGFAIAKAQAMNLKDHLCISVPKAQKDFPPSLQDGINV